MTTGPSCEKIKTSLASLSQSTRRESMITVPRMARVLRQVFEQEARTLARQMGVIKRERKLTGASLLLLLVLGWLHQPAAGSSALARFAGTLGITISKQA